MDQLVVPGDILQENIPVANPDEDHTRDAGEVVDSTELVEAPGRCRSLWRTMHEVQR